MTTRIIIAHILTFLAFLYGSILLGPLFLIPAVFTGALQWLTVRLSRDEVAGTLSLAAGWALVSCLVIPLWPCGALHVLAQLAAPTMSIQACQRSWV